MLNENQQYPNKTSAKFCLDDERRNTLKAWVIIAALYIVLFVLLSIALAPNGGKQVYITHRGECYHKSGCSGLNYSKSPITLEQAVISGYGPCSNCHPPILTAYEPEVSLSFASLLSLFPISFVLSVLVWMYSVFMFHFFAIPEDQIRLRWYPISSFLFLICLYLSMSFPA